MVNRNLDINTVVGELNSLQFIIHYLLRDYQRSLVQLATFNYFVTREEQENEEKQKNKVSPIKPAEDEKTKGKNRLEIYQNSFNVLESKFDSRGTDSLTKEQKTAVALHPSDHKSLGEPTTAQLSSLGFRKEIEIDLDKQLFEQLKEDRLYKTGAKQSVPDSSFGQLQERGGANILSHPGHEEHRLMGDKDPKILTPDLPSKTGSPDPSSNKLPPRIK